MACQELGTGLCGPAFLLSSRVSWVWVLSDAGPGVIGRRVSLMGRGQEELARGNPPPLFFRSCAGLRAPGAGGGGPCGRRDHLPPGLAGAPRGGGGGAGARGFAVATAVMSLAHPNPRLVVVCFSSACS